MLLEDMFIKLYGMHLQGRYLFVNKKLKYVKATVIIQEWEL